MAAAKPGTTENAVSPPVKKNKKLLWIIVALALLIGGGVAAYLIIKTPHTPAKDTAADNVNSNDATGDEARLSIPPKYVALGTFTANLIREEGDRYLQVAISIKVSKPELEDQIKARNPEILHNVNMLLESKRPSELATMQGKEKLAGDIKIQIERVLGFRKADPADNSVQSASAPVSAPVSAPAIAGSVQTNSGIEEVLFTSFIIQ